MFTQKQMETLNFLVTKFEAIAVPLNFAAKILFLQTNFYKIWTYFSFIYNSTNLLFTRKQKKVTDFLMARIKPFEVSDKF